MSGLGRIDQFGGEAIGVLANWLRVNQAGEEVIGPMGIDARIDQLAGEAIGIMTPLVSDIALDQLAGEAIGLQSGLRARIDQLAGEVIGIIGTTTAFVVTSFGKLHTAATARIHFDATSTGLVDTGASLSAVDSSLWDLRNGSSCSFLRNAVVTSVGAATVDLEQASFEVNEGHCTLGTTSAATTRVTLGAKSSLNVVGALSIDDSSSLTLAPGSTLTIARGGSLTLNGVQFVVTAPLVISSKVVINGGGGYVTGGGSVIANFTWDEHAGTGAPMSVYFTDTSYLADPFMASWAWNFGDGASSNLRNPVHNFAAPGDYNVTLTTTQYALNAPPSTSTIVQVVTVTEVTPP